MHTLIFIPAYTQVIREKGRICGSLLLLLLLDCGCHLPVLQEEGIQALGSAFVDHPMTVDAQIQEPEWRFAPMLTAESSTPATDRRMFTRALWNEDFLYMAFQVEGSFGKCPIMPSRVSLSTEEKTESFFVDVCRKQDSTWISGETAYHIILENPRWEDIQSSNDHGEIRRYGTAKGAIRILNANEFKTGRSAAFLIELALPWRELGIYPVPGKKVRLDFANADNGVFFNGKGDWCYHAPGVFINLVLKRIMVEHS